MAKLLMYYYILIFLFSIGGSDDIPKDHTDLIEKGENYEQTQYHSNNAVSSTNNDSSDDDYEFLDDKNSSENNYKALDYEDKLFQGQPDAHDDLLKTSTQGLPQSSIAVFQEGVISKDDARTRKPLQAPKSLIVLYTFLILLVIGSIVMVSVWKNPFKRFSHSSAAIKKIPEEGKRLLDHDYA